MKKVEIDLRLARDLFFCVTHYGCDVTPGDIFNLAQAIAKAEAFPDAANMKGNYPELKPTLAKANSIQDQAFDCWVKVKKPKHISYSQVKDLIGELFIDYWNKEGEKLFDEEVKKL